jgi:hypothetical protein
MQNIVFRGEWSDARLREEIGGPKENSPPHLNFDECTYKPTVQDSYAGQRLWVESSNGWCEEKTANYRPLPD